MVGVIVTDSRLPGCGCKPEINDKECIKQLTPEAAALDSFWGGAPLRRRELSLSMTYLFLTGGVASPLGQLLPPLQNPGRPPPGPGPPAPPKPHRGQKRRKRHGP